MPASMAPMKHAGASGPCRNTSITVLPGGSERDCSSVTNRSARSSAWARVTSRQAVPSWKIPNRWSGRARARSRMGVRKAFSVVKPGIGASIRLRYPPPRAPAPCGRAPRQFSMSFHFLGGELDVQGVLDFHQQLHLLERIPAEHIFRSQLRRGHDIRTLEHLPQNIRVRNS